MLKALLKAFFVSLPLVACTQTTDPQATPSLRGTSDVSFICAAYDADGNLVGRPPDSCPRYYDSSEERALFALAAQRETGEVALVDMSRCDNGARCSGRVRDLEPTQPGINFMAVGAEPVSIVSTPGGMASFVAVAEPGREGIYGLPTSCVGPRPDGAAYRDLRTWPACRLPAAPGSVEILVDKSRQTDCSGASGVPAEGRECPADLRQEFVEPGRRKLLVTLPSMGQLLVLDAQTVLNGAPGQFDECSVEQVLQLGVELPSGDVEQAVPEDLQTDDASCLPQSFTYGPLAGEFSAEPSDVSQVDGRIYLSDASAPVIHVVDTEDACALEELPPLLPRSYTRPESVVTTRRLAVSPMTTQGQQFIYAVDGSDTGLAGSLMIFDVTPGRTQRTPILRPRSDYVSQEPPDRIRFDQEVRDVEFASQDFPETDPATGVGVEGLLCDPDPDATGASTLYRPNSDGTGAGPLKLRGVFAFAALHSGYVTVIDVEDLDAPCRRHKVANPSDEPNIHGCFGDDQSGEFELEDGGIVTVSNESSCNVVVPHRARSATYFHTGSNGTEPFLRSFPQLRSGDGTSLAVDRTERGKGHPRLLGVNFTPGEGAGRQSEGDASVLVGATEYVNQPSAADRLMLDPALSERNSTILPFIEPRAYGGASGLNTVTYEGTVRPFGQALYSIADSEALTHTGLSGVYGVFDGGQNAEFCGFGIEDELVMRGRGAEMMPSADAALLEEFGYAYSDYVDIVQKLLPKDDPYWDDEGRSCGRDYQSGGDTLDGRSVCELFFGTPDLPDRHRELRVVRAFADRLIVEPRQFSSRGERNATLDLVDCCFPGGVDFIVRASRQWVRRDGGSFAHPIRANVDTLACEKDCGPMARFRNGRAFEVSCDDGSDNDDTTPDDGLCADNAEGADVIGPRAFGGEDEEDELENELSRALTCVIDAHPGGGIQPGGPGSECIYDSLTARFVIYRGLAPSQRDMQFAWNTFGGFLPLSVDLFDAVRYRTTTMPERLHYIPSVNWLAVADGGTTGVSFVGLKGTNGGPGVPSGTAF